MMSKTDKFADGHAKKLCQSQGGAYRDQGPKSVSGKGKKNAGDEHDVSSVHMSHDRGMHAQGGASRGVLPINRSDSGGDGANSSAGKV